MSENKERPIGSGGGGVPPPQCKSKQDIDKKSDKAEKAQKSERPDGIIGSGGGGVPPPQ